MTIYKSALTLRISLEVEWFFSQKQRWYGGLVSSFAAWSSIVCLMSNLQEDINVFSKNRKAISSDPIA